MRDDDNRWNIEKKNFDDTFNSLISTCKNGNSREGKKNNN